MCASRSELLCGALLLSSLLAFRRAFVGRRPPMSSSGCGLAPRASKGEQLATGALGSVSALLGFGLALGTKETAAMLPFVLIGV